MLGPRGVHRALLNIATQPELAVSGEPASGGSGENPPELEFGRRLDLVPGSHPGLFLAAATRPLLRNDGTAPVRSPDGKTSAQVPRLSDPATGW
jgi:hypothetical protein